jgi:peptidoglycan/xylan/chitin deacetylase (PgdA/CDA1 family)
MGPDRFDYSPIIDRPVIKWPSGARVALCAIVNLEHWDWELPADAPVPVSPLGGRASGFGGGGGRFPDIAGYSQQEYGNRVGVFRVLQVLDKYGVKPTVAMDKAVAENYPFLVRECQKRELEVIGHGTTARRIIHADMSEAEEQAYIHESVEALTRMTSRFT